MRLDGCELPLLEPPPVEALAHSARGLPRRIHRTALYALTAATAQGARTVTDEHIEHAVAEAAAVSRPSLLVPHELRDETAAQLCELLNGLAV